MNNLEKLSVTRIYLEANLVNQQANLINKLGKVENKRAANIDKMNRVAEVRNNYQRKLAQLKKKNLLDVTRAKSIPNPEERRNALIKIRDGYIAGKDNLKQEKEMLINKIRDDYKNRRRPV